jgi:hypothetical protein
VTGTVVEVVVEVVLVDVVDVEVDELVVDGMVVVVVVGVVAAAAAVGALAAFESLPHAAIENRAAHETTITREVGDRRRIASVCQRHLPVRQQGGCLLARPDACGDADSVVTGSGKSDSGW